MAAEAIEFSSSVIERRRVARPTSRPRLYAAPAIGTSRGLAAAIRPMSAQEPFFADVGRQRFGVTGQFRSLTGSVQFARLGVAWSDLYTSMR